MTVYLVGAGPGDPDLLTLRAASLLARADVIVHDRLIDRRILASAAPWAELIDVGKTPGSPCHSQAEINRILVQCGTSHDVVVRLKGGDPFVFGRAGEEIDALEAAGIAYTIVPGISSVLASSAAAGVPLTDRRHSPMFTVVTGHSCVSNVDPPWRDLAQLGGTLVVLMGVQRRREIASKLIDAGAAPSTPVIAVERASQPDERTVRTTLAGLSDTALVNPATLIIQLHRRAPQAQPASPPQPVG
jgi:uroporphyrin-III C-methyltransferase